jgi:hypothetical protein
MRGYHHYTSDYLTFGAMHVADGANFPKHLTEEWCDLCRDHGRADFIIRVPDGYLWILPGETEGYLVVES